MSELIQAVIILAHVHSLASLVTGLRLSPAQSANAANRTQSHDDQGGPQLDAVSILLFISSW